ncbi:MAG TPA: SHOCT domain-containing protein [Acidimicrobiales bacterium]|nr:SHOCT domain-containing protein [Acidimicrobiales bacterium]
MKKIVRVVLACAAIAAAVGSFTGHLARAHAQEEGYDTTEECIASFPMGVDIMDRSCVRVNGGKWVPQKRNDMGDAGSAFGAFIIFALLWAAVPLVIAATMASNRGESVGSAVGLTLFLGWIGLAIVYFGQSKARAAVEGLASGAAPPRASAPAAPTATKTPAPGAPDDRLRRLERLRADGLIDDDEYADQRRRILESL